MVNIYLGKRSTVNPNVNWKLLIGVRRPEDVLSRFLYCSFTQTVCHILYVSYSMSHIRGDPFFGPEKCLKEFILTWLTCFKNPILVHPIFLRNSWSLVQIWFWSTLQHFEFPISVQILTSNCNWTKIGNSNYWKVDQNRIGHLIMNFKEKSTAPKLDFWGKSITWE